MKVPRVPRTFKLPPDLIAAYEARAAEQGITRTEAVESALRGWLGRSAPPRARAGRIAPAGPAAPAERAAAPREAPPGALTDRAAAFRAAAERRRA